MARVAFIGDSITADCWGWWATFNGLSGGFWLPTANLAVGGTQSGQILTTVAAALATSPDAVSVLAGTNDIGQGVAPATIIANISATWSAINAGGKQILCYPIPPRIHVSNTAARNADLVTVNAWIRSNAAAYGARLFDWSSALTTDGGETAYDATLFQDGVHPNDVGQYRMGERMAARR